jgi:hypothetical protein
MLPPDLDSPTQVQRYYNDRFDTLIQSGDYSPVVYPWASIGAGVVLLYMLLDHRTSPTLQTLRIPTFAVLFLSSTWIIVNLKARSPAGAYGLGICCSFGTLWIAALILFNDCQRDFQRIQRKEDGTLHWQSYPAKPLSARMDWISDLLLNFRGVGWSFQTTGIPPVPKDHHTTTVSFTGIQRFASRPLHLRYVVIRLILGFFVLDLIKTMMNHDPYFWGYIDADPPPWLPFASSSVGVKSYRLLLSCAGLSTALNEIFRLQPLLFVGVLGPRYAGLRGEAWMQPADYWGSFALILDKGLAGWWGGFWHQTFRFAFEAPARWVLQRLGMDPKSPGGKVVGLFVSFGLSGCLHASGSYTQLGDTRPFRGPFCFFMAQAVGISLQTFASHQLKTAPGMMRRGGNLFFVMVWLYWTAPLLVDDFARGGIWLYEPIAFSPLRALGWGAKDDTSMNLWSGLLYWRKGERWWDTGVGF